MNKLALEQWKKQNGDYTHRLNYDLNKDSLVFDVGGYKGWFTNQIFNKYGCNVYVFEPIKAFYEIIKKQFENNPKILIHQYGLSNSTKEIVFYDNVDSTSAYRNHKNKGKPIIVQLKDFDEYKNYNIDLLKLNIEGEEYPLLEYILSQGIIYNIDNIQVQFHNFIDNAPSRRDNIRNELSKTHELTYDFEFVWENWKRK